MQARWVFIDWDGTMTNLWKRYYQAHKFAVESLNIVFRKYREPLSLKPLNKSDFKAIFREGYGSEFIADRIGVPKSYLIMFTALVNARVNSPELLVHDRLIASARKALEIFQERGYGICIVTLNWTQYVESVVLNQNLPISKVYGLSIGTSIVNAKEQKRMILQDAIKDKVERPYLQGQYWMIGDSDIDVWAGKLNGLGTIATSNGTRSYGFHLRSEVQADYVTNDLLAAAKIVTRVKDRIES